MLNTITENALGADNHAGKIQDEESLRQKDKAYLFGVFLGDGCCSKFTKHYCFNIISEDEDVVNRTMQIVNKLFNKNYHTTYQMPNNLRLYRFKVASNKSLFEMLKSETLNKTQLPKSITYFDMNSTKELISGLMDTDGYISIGKNKLGYQKFSLGFINSGEWLDQFIRLLGSIGVKVGKKTLKKKYRSSNEKDCFQININLRSLLKQVYTLIVEESNAN